MTDPRAEDGNYLVRVRAQVMSRDDSSGGWVPLGGGGLSNVSVRKRPRPTPSSGGGGQLSNDAQPTKPKHDYLIYGKRISDNSIVLSCTIKKDFEYNKVMPTFHHWKTGDKKYGLTFQAAADARAFDKGVKTAIEDLLDDVGDDDVFMTLDLPQGPKDSRSSSDSSAKGTEHLHKITYIGRDSKPLDARLPTYDPQKATKDVSVQGGGENYPYVQLTAVHEYIYPAEDQQKPPLMRRDSTSSLKKCTISMEMNPPQQPPLPFKAVKHKGKIKIRCRHCHELYVEDRNPRGACEYAPDVVKSTINQITCLGCAEGIDYHCASDQEGDFAQHPCDCSDENCTKRWLCLTFLSIFVPCLWLYPPLKMCHWCGVKCGICGGRHSM
ncbi:sprouty-related, EVH1 domain-containing protein 1 isoform X2 [Diorhabda carinulata]|uniref:sprouty-related, EVH1 domain-containing protein 1 isoform X2 n=1 Tax=Diorhabda carinulata TaxID=1163345 RepID=UPI0025A2517D|nr:sprouty-related, EVH1 domain-containing protein 1 isoform X2 [Diorhabda carinulata]